MINSLGGLDNVPEMTGDETIEVTQTQEQRKGTQEVKKAANGLCTNGVTVVGTTCLWQRHLHTAYAICSNAQKEKSRDAALCDNWFKADLRPKREIGKCKTC